jgi:hypothetical protein
MGTSMDVVITICLTGSFLVYIMEGWYVILLEVSIYCIDD